MATTTDYSAQINSLVESINTNYDNNKTLQSQCTTIAQNLITIFFTNVSSNPKVGATNTPVPPTTHIDVLQDLVNDPNASQYVCYNFGNAQPQYATKNNNFYCGWGVAAAGQPLAWYCTKDLSQLYLNSVNSYNTLMQQLIALNENIYTQEQQVQRLQGAQTSANTEQTSLALSSPSFLQYRLSLNAFYVAMVLLFLLLLIWYIRSKS